MNLIHFEAIDVEKVAAKAGLLVAWVAAVSIAGVLTSSAALGYATQHVHDQRHVTAGSVVHVTYHSFDHSTAGIMAISSLVALLWLVITALVTALMVVLWDEI